MAKLPNTKIMSIKFKGSGPKITSLLRFLDVVSFMQMFTEFEEGVESSPNFWEAVLQTK